MTRISQRQVLFFLACIAPVGKLVILPALLVQKAGNDLLFPAALQFLLQAAAVFCVLLLSAKGESFYDLLLHAFGKIAAKIFTTLFAVFLLFAALLPTLEQELLVQTVFYDTLPSLIAFAPYFVFAVFLVAKPLASLGRVWDVLAFFFLAGLAGIVVLSVASVDFSALAPVGASGVKGIFGGTMSAFPWFFDAVLLLPFLGKIEYRRGLAVKGMLAYLAGGAAVLLFMAMFYGIFLETAVNQLFAFTATSKYFSGITMLGRIDYVFIFAISLVMAFYTAQPVQSAVECALQAYGRRKYLPVLLAAGFILVYVLLVVLLDYRFTEVLHAMTTCLVPIFPVFTLAVPALMLLVGRFRRA